MNRLKLISEFKDELAQMSYFNAAQSDWDRESGARNKCKMRLKALARQLMDTGSTFDELKEIRSKGNFLVTEYDFKPNIVKE